MLQHAQSGFGPDKGIITKQPLEETLRRVAREEPSASHTASRNKQVWQKAA